MSKVSASMTPESKIYKQNPAKATFNPFDSDSDREQNARSTRASSATAIKQSQRRCPQSIYHDPEGIRDNRCKNDFHEFGIRESGSFENQSVQELESYSVKKAEETTRQVNDCVKIAEDIREVSSRTLINLHQQGEQITRTHMTAANIDHDLSRGEKLLGSLGGLFSKTWKPKKTRQINGPNLTRDDSFIRRGNHMEQRQNLGLDSRRSRSNPRQALAGPSSSLDRVETEKAKQDDALSDLSSLLGELKAMATDMGSEIDRTDFDAEIMLLHHDLEKQPSCLRRLGFVY